MMSIPMAGEQAANSSQATLARESDTMISSRFARRTIQTRSPAETKTFAIMMSHVLRLKI
jgi:hypothetical protein